MTCFYFRMVKWDNPLTTVAPIRGQKRLLGEKASVDMCINLWYCVSRLSWDVIGGAIALDVIIGFRVIMLMVWTILINWNKSRSGAEDLTWPGWSLQAFNHWGEIVKLGVYTMMMMSIRGWEFDYFTLMSGCCIPCSACLLIVLTSRGIEW